MSDAENKDGDKPQTLGTESILSLDLSFAPDWARKPSKSGGTGSSNPDRGDTAEHERRNWGSRDGRGGRDDRNSRSGPGGRDRGSDRGRAPVRRGKPDHARPAAPVEPIVEAPRLPNFRLRILPTSKALSSLVRQIHAARKAYPLRRLATLLLSNPDHCSAKIELDPDKSNPSLFLCSACQSIALTRQSLMTHILQNHFADHFTVEEKECEAPGGLFVCVARCKRTGVLLGPPNHHSYAEKIEETRRAHFPDMPDEVYRNGIETIRDPAMIEQWKEQSKRQTFYRLKQVGSDAGAEPMKWPAAAAYMTEKVAPLMIAEVRKANVPLPVAMKTGDKLLDPIFKNAWVQETRSPRSMMLAIRMAFRHMRLHVFRAGKWGDLVSATRPCQMDWEHAVESIRRIHGILRASGIIKQEALFAAIQGGEAGAGLSNDETINSLRWLIEKGHIIELYDGSLMVPHFPSDSHKPKDNPVSNPEPALPAKPEGEGAAAPAPTVMPEGEGNPEPAPQL